MYNFLWCKHKKHTLSQLKFLFTFTMSVQLISVTQAIDKDGWTPEDLIAYMARVSNPENQLYWETYPKLLSYLIKHGHWSPFEMVHMTVQIETSRAIAHQLIRHRSFSFQEFSQRYSDVHALDQSLAGVVQARGQHPQARQGSLDNVPEEKAEWFAQSVKDMKDQCFKLYKDALQAGIAREQARMVLPESCRTRLYMTGSARSWMHYLDARLSSDTQTEHRLLAQEIRKIFKEQFPTLDDCLFGFPFASSS